MGARKTVFGSFSWIGSNRRVHRLPRLRFGKYRRRVVADPLRVTILEDHFETHGLILERVESGVYRRKGAWYIERYPSDPKSNEVDKVNGAFQAEGANRLKVRKELGLDEGEFADRWEGGAYVLKITLMKLTGL